MTQTSWWWDGHTTGDAAVNAPYDMDQWAAIYKMIYTPDPNNQGVIGGTLNSLAVTVGESSVTIDTGAAIVNGRLYYNDAPITFAINGPWTYWLVGLITDTNTQSTRAFVRGGYLSYDDALNSLIHLSTFWEIPLAVAYVQLPGVGNIIWDKRYFVLRPHHVKTFVPAVSCRNDTDMVNISMNSNRGFPTPDAHVSTCVGSFLVPNNFWKLLTVKAIVDPGVGGAGSGNVYSSTTIYYGPLHDAYSTYYKYAITSGYAATRVVSNGAILINQTPYINSLNSGRGQISDYLRLRFDRDAVNVLDTAGTIYFSGWLFEYDVLY